MSPLNHCRTAKSGAVPELTTVEPAPAERPGKFGLVIPDSNYLILNNSQLQIILI